MLMAEVFWSFFFFFSFLMTRTHFFENFSPSQSEHQNAEVVPSGSQSERGAGLVSRGQGGGRERGSEFVNTEVCLLLISDGSPSLLKLLI